MAVTLEQAKLNVQTDLDKMIIDEFRKDSWFMDNLQFHEAVSPTGGGTTLTYGYTRVKAPASAEFRNVNEEYTAQEATKEQHFVDLKIFGGSFKIDRVIAGLGGIVDEVGFQAQQKVKAANQLFNNTVINGDAAQDGKVFDGLEKALKGSSTEYNANGAEIDLSTSAAITANYMLFLDELENFLSTLDGTPSALLGNSMLINKIKACGRRSSMYTETKDSFGRDIATYGGVALVDLGRKPGDENKPVVDIKGGLTDLYAVRLGMDGLHGVSAVGQVTPKLRLPNFDEAGAVKIGDVEMLAAIALKSTKAAGVMRKIKVS